MAKTVKQMDEQFEDFLNKLVFEQTETELTPELRSKRRALADADDFQFCKTYFPQIFNDDWNELHLFINRCKRGNYTCSGSRNFGKTTFGLVTKIIKPLCLGGENLIGLGMRTQPDSYARGAALVRLIKRNKILNYDYDIQIQQDREGDWIINNIRFVGVGVREGLRNFADDNFKRFSILILDDLFNKLTVSSELDNAKVIDFVTSEAYGQMRPDGLCIWFFNIIKDNSPGDKQAKANPEGHFNLPALNSDEKTNWPGSSVYTTEYLYQKRSELPFDVWQGDWMNDPILLGEIMDLNWIKGINMNFIKIITSLTAIDPSTGKSPSACSKGIVTAALTDKDDVIFTDIYIRKEPYDKVFDYINSVRQYSPYWKVLLFENDFEQFFNAKPYYDNWLKEKGTPIPIVPFSAKMLKTEHYGSDKEGRMMNLVFPHQMGKIFYNEMILKSFDFQLYKKNYIGFGKEKTKLDGFDAAATAYIMIRRYRNVGSFKSGGKRKSKETLFRIFQ